MLSDSEMFFITGAVDLCYKDVGSVSTNTVTVFLK